MKSSATSTDLGGTPRDSEFQPWHFYLILSMCGAIWAVIVSPDTHPAALLLLSGGVMAAGLVGLALHHALMGFFGDSRGTVPRVVSGRTREFLEQEKALVLRSIKELEFDRAMRKLSDADFAEIGGRLRVRAMELMEELDRAAAPGRSRSEPAPVPAPAAEPRCASCNATNDRDARFCKGCGARLQ